MDIDECTRTKGICGRNTNCFNTVGSYSCNCWTGFQMPTPILKKIIQFNIDECLSGVCGPYGTCYNNIGSFVCNCSKGFRADYSITCIDICGPDCNCSNTIGSYLCTCIPGYRINNPAFIANIDECTETPGICGEMTVCTNVPGTFYCSCPDGLFPTTGIVAWILNVTYCQSESISTIILNCFKVIYLVSSEGDGAMGNAILDLSEYIVVAMTPPTENQTKKEVHSSTVETGTVSCVYWKTTETVEGKSMSWSEEGCWIAFSNENYTICSCSHLSTFALIMQIGEFMTVFPEWLNRVCVIIGLFFLALAILTFLLCSWNPKINNTARLHLCLNLFFSQLLLLWNDKYTDNKLACTVMAGLLHFLIVASFVWMLLEALQLHLLVRRLSKVQVIRRDGLPRPILYLVGYGVPFVIVGVSALIYSDGYGVTSSNVCFLSTKRNFNWALTGPIVAVLINWLLFLATLWSLRPTLANMKSDVSQSKDTRLIVFKIVAQFVILGCTWILGLYQTNLFFQVLFIILNSQQGTFLYIVHCLLNKEVREEYIKWLTCSIGKEAAEVSLVKNSALSRAVLEISSPVTLNLSQCTS
uniref:Adhesion G protein-coupled receptor E8 n=1 Tax=Oreochromis niloticus TaxID=8128 RepID=I3J136_ORENI